MKAWHQDVRCQFSQGYPRRGTEPRLRFFRRLIPNLNSNLARLNYNQGCGFIVKNIETPFEILPNIAIYSKKPSTLVQVNLEYGLKRYNLKILNFYYNFVGNSDVIKYLLNRKIKISWVVEAGCHDGEDTIRMSRSLNPSRIIAFEPDEHARLKAMSAYASNSLDVELHAFGLSDKDSSLFLNFLNGVEGTGSTFLAETGSSVVEVKRFDGLGLNLSYGGLLWLDVEGHATQALRGSSQNLANLIAAKVEIQMHKMSDSRAADYHDVNKIMLSHGLIPVRVPIYPGFFGDVIYVNKKELTFMDKIWSLSLILQMRLLHDFVYPLLGKPKSVSKP